MTRKSKRELERDLSELESDATADGDGVLIYYTDRSFETREDAPRPELTIPDTMMDGYETATPDVLPEEHAAPILFITKATVDTWEHDAGDSPVPVSELWDALSDEQRREEYRTRKENDDPIPPLLEDYAR